MNRKKKRTAQATVINALVWVFLIIAAIYILAPLVFMFTASVMPAGDIMKMPYRWIPKGFYWQNYWQGIRGNDGSFIYLRNIFNSLVVASIVTMTTVFLSALTGYGLAKFHFKGRYIVFMMILATMMIPFEVIMIPLYLIITKLGIQNSYPGLITPFLVTAFGIFLMRQYYVTFPDEILDAARIDGARDAIHADSTRLDRLVFHPVDPIPRTHAPGACGRHRAGRELERHGGGHHRFACGGGELPENRKEPGQGVELRRRDHDQQS